jgi:NAD(P)H-dependent flavin oxidoreductase YrpB (nitropropane dioxygenase family)
MKTRLTELLKIHHSILLGGMAGMGDARQAAP